MLVMSVFFLAFIWFFLSAPPTTEIYTLSLHDALPISTSTSRGGGSSTLQHGAVIAPPERDPARSVRSEEHTSELQSHSDLVCRLLLEKKNDGFLHCIQMDTSVNAANLYVSLGADIAFD